MRVDFTLNSEVTSVDVEPRMTLADCLRRSLKLTGTHVSCAHGVCGACTILVDGEAVRSCLMLAVQTTGSSVTTIEGLSRDDELTPLQAAFRRHGAVQCGFCTVGIVVSAHALLTSEPEADADRVREVVGGHICRCTGYVSIVAAILDAAQSYVRSRQLARGEAGHDI